MPTIEISPGTGDGELLVDNLFKHKLELREIIMITRIIVYDRVKEAPLEADEYATRTLTGNLESDFTTSLIVATDATTGGELSHQPKQMLGWAGVVFTRRLRNVSQYIT